MLAGAFVWPLGMAARGSFGQEPPLAVALPVGVGAGHDLRGQRVLAGALTCFKRVNAAGGVHGRSIELVTFNDDGAPGRLGAGLRELARQRAVVAVLGTLGDRASEAAAEVADELRLPLVAPLSGTEAIERMRHPSVFRLRPGHTSEARALARQLRGMGCTQAALVQDPGPQDGPGRSIAAALGQHGLQVTPLAWDGTGASPGRAALEAMGKGGFHAAVLNMGLPSLTDLVRNQLAARDEWPGVIAAISAGDPGSMLGSFPRRNIVFTSVVPHPEVLTKKLAREFNQDVELHGSGFAVTFEGLEAYLGARLVVEALRRLPAGRRPAAADVQSTLESAPGWDIAGFHLDFGKGRATGSDWVDVVMRSRSGALVTLGPLPTDRDTRHAQVHAESLPRTCHRNPVPSGADIDQRDPPCLS